MKALNKNKTWGLVEIPKSMITTWVFKVKKTADGEKNYKRELQRGFSQKYGENDFDPR